MVQYRNVLWKSATSMTCHYHVFRQSRFLNNCKLYFDDICRPYRQKMKLLGYDFFLIPYDFDVTIGPTLVVLNNYYFLETIYFPIVYIIFFLFPFRYNAYLQLLARNALSNLKPKLFIR